MWNCDWEYKNQETLKQWYEEKISGVEPDLAVRKIICKGCGRVFYTQITSKKYCYYHLCGNRGYPKDLKQRRAGKTTKSYLQGLWENLYPQAVGCGLLLQCLPPVGLSPKRYG